MTHKLDIGDDHILRLIFVGELDDAAIISFEQEFLALLETVSSEAPLSILIDDAPRTGKFSAQARQMFTRLNNDPRVGNIGVINASRFVQVMSNFIMKVNRKDNTHYFNSEAEALAWLKAAK